MTFGVSSQTKRQWAVMALVIPITILLGLDMIDDYRSGVSTEHLMIEIAFSTLGLIGGGLLVEAANRAREREWWLKDRLTKSIAEAERLKGETKSPPAQHQSLDQQFGHWQLSPAEKEVALLLLKGFSYQQIAASRNASEGTIRQQALSVYRKAGLGGRSELAAFFLGDRLVPPGRTGDSEWPLDTPR